MIKFLSSFSLKERVRIIKKFVACLSIISILLSLFIYKPIGASAEAVPSGGTITSDLGKQALITIMEQSGIKFENDSARKRAIEAWNMESYKRFQQSGGQGEFYKWLDDLNNGRIKPTPIPDKPNLGKIAVKAFTYLSAFGLGYEIGNFIYDSWLKEKPVDIYIPMGEQVGIRGVYPIEAFGFYYREFFDASDSDQYQFFDAKGYFRNSFRRVKGSPYSVTVYEFKPTDHPDMMYVGIHWQYHEFTGEMVDIYSDLKLWYVDPDVIRSWVQTYYVPTEDDIPIIDVPSVIPMTPDGSVITEVPDYFPQEIEIIVPMEISNPYAEPVADNVPISELVTNPDTQPEPEPNPDEGNGDGESEGGDGEKPPSKPSEVNWRKLIGALQGFTRIFPFSIPWDIERAFNALFGTVVDSTSPPVFQWGIDFNGHNWTFDIRIPDFIHEAMPFVRALIVILFDISVIYALQRWFGGAT